MGFPFRLHDCHRHTAQSTKQIAALILIECVLHKFGETRRRDGVYFASEVAKPGARVVTASSEAACMYVVARKKHCGYAEKHGEKFFNEALSAASKRRFPQVLLLLWREALLCFET